MDRLTKYSKQTSHENGVCCTHFYGPECIRVGGDCAMNCKWEEAVWSRLAAYEDTNLAPEGVAKLLGNLIQCAADRKDLINELCQYCGKYKHAHEGACDGCRWKQ